MSLHRSGTGSATPTSGGKGDSSSGSNLGDLESSDKSSVGSQDDKAHAALNMGELQFPRNLSGLVQLIHVMCLSKLRRCQNIFLTVLL